MHPKRDSLRCQVVATTPKFSSRALQALAGDWQISDILSISSGAFWTATLGRDNSLTGVNLDRPNLAGSYALSQRTFNRWFDATAFQAGPAGAFGNLGRTNILGPKTIYCDFGLVRQFPVRERSRLEFRAEAFNAINHANLDTSVTNALHTALSDPKFGAITGAADPRILQFALKLIF